MSKVIHLKKGLDINLQGVSEKVLIAAPLAQEYALTPDDYIGVVPKLLVKVDDTVKAGTPLFFDKKHPEILFTSPVSGTVTAINRGEKRKILNIIIRPSEEREYEEFNVPQNRRAHGRIAQRADAQIGSLAFRDPASLRHHSRPGRHPARHIRIGFRLGSARRRLRLHTTQTSGEDFAAGIEAVKKLTPGNVHLGLSDESHSKIFAKLEDKVQIAPSPAPIPPAT